MLNDEFSRFDYVFVEAGDIRVFEYPNASVIDDGCDAVTVRSVEEAECIIESLTRFIKAQND